MHLRSDRGGEDDLWSGENESDMGTCNEGPTVSTLTGARRRTDCEQIGEKAGSQPSAHLSCHLK